MSLLNQSQLKSAQKNAFIKAVIIGFVGGILWSFLFVLLYGSKIIAIDPMIILRKIVGNKSWLDNIYAYVFLIFIIGLLSIVIAIGYFYTLKKIESWLAGAMYGIILWGILFLVLPTIINGLASLGQYSSETYIATFCILLLYGIFVGYSISFDFKNLLSQQNN